MTQLPPGPPLPAEAQTALLWRWPHHFLEYCCARYGKQFTIHAIGKPPLVIFAHPVDIRSVLNAPADALHPGAGAVVLAPLVGDDSFMLLDEAPHMAGRAAITPYFRQELVARDSAAIRAIVVREMRKWPLDIPFAIHRHLRALALRVVLRAVFGDEDRQLRELHSRLLAMLSVADSLLIQQPQLRYLPGWRGIQRRFLQSRSEVDRLLCDLIAARSGSPVTAPIRLVELQTRRDDSPNSAWKTKVRDDLMSVILAGHETTAAALSWTFLLLAHTPRVQQRLVEEIDGKEEDHYLTATLREVLRHKPVFPFTIPRVVNQHFRIGDKTYEPPVHLVGCIHLLHHDAQIYPAPQTFLPERFLIAPPKALDWRPWGGGNKLCPGRTLALLEMRLTLAEVLSERSILPASPEVENPRWRSVILTPRQGGRIILSKRSQA